MKNWSFCFWFPLPIVSLSRSCLTLHPPICCMLQTHRPVPWVAKSVLILFLQFLRLEGFPSQPFHSKSCSFCKFHIYCDLLYEAFTDVWDRINGSLHLFTSRFLMSQIEHGLCFSTDQFLTVSPVLLWNTHSRAQVLGLFLHNLCVLLLLFF